MNVLFVCTGNICRSPLAQALFERDVRALGASDRIHAESVGVTAEHEGQHADPRMRTTAERRGVRIDHRARRITRRDLEWADLVIAMDDGHVRSLGRLISSMRLDRPVPVRKLREFDPEANSHGSGSGNGAVDGGGAPDVPDPWYGDMSGFERVHEMVERSCRELARSVASTEAELRRHEREPRSVVDPVLSRLRIDDDPTEELTTEEWGEIE